MKKLNLSHLLVLLAVSVFLFSCGSSDPGPQVLLPKLDGFYVYGTNTIASSPSDPAAKMNLAILDKTKTPAVDNMDGIYGKIIYIGANSTINFVNVSGADGKIYGADGGGTVSNGTDLHSVNDDVINGTLKENGAGVKIASEGLYYAYANTIDNSFIIMQIKPDMIGPATPGGWATSTPLPQVSVSLDSAIFKADMHLLGGDTGYKYRLSTKGWAVFDDGTNIVTLSSMGVPNYGDAWDSGINNIGFFNPTCPQIETGDFSVILKYTANGDTWSERKVRDYSNIKIGFKGSAWEGGSWDDIETAYGVGKPVKDGFVYTYTWANVDLIADNEFVILENGDWGGLQIFWDNGTAHSGDAITNNDLTKASDSQNFHVSVAGKYTLVLRINAYTGGKSLTVTEVK